MGIEKDIEEILKRIIDKAVANGITTIIGIATNIDEEKRTITLHREGMEDIEEVRLNAVAIAENELTIIPKDGSAVVVMMVDGVDVGIMVCSSEIEKINIAAGKTTMSIATEGINIASDKMKMDIKNEEILFNGGENKGIVKIQELTDKINTLVDAFNNHTHLLPSGTVIVAGSPSTQQNATPIQVPAILSKAQKLNKTDFENDKIKH